MPVPKQVIENSATSHIMSGRFSLNRQDACSTRKFTLCGTGILPVPKQVIENSATSHIMSGRFSSPRLFKHLLTNARKFG
ncbi:hypothetical protein [Microcoleus sp. B5-D4]|uniref:hypothetical protein n=1 Tax=Microcoleus sp. B5-D4 TaxID=2818681 RepID=UPI002FD09B23